MVKKNYVYIPRSFLVINVCIKGKTLCSPCRLWDPKPNVTIKNDKKFWKLTQVMVKKNRFVFHVAFL